MSQINPEVKPELILERLFIEGLVSSSEKEELGKVIGLMLADKEISRFFTMEGDVISEPEILAADGHLYRPDRLLINHGKVTIIDFKTGRYHEHHREQVQKYAELLIEMKYEIEGAYLVYLNRNPEMKQVI
jgi:predicted nuclease of restriction endonuclease-like RecB superfamily